MNIFVILGENYKYMPFKKKIDPTREGFQELWDSFQNPTIDRLIAGIQSKRTSEEEILNLTEEIRNSHSLLDKELFHLSKFAQDYNQKWATKKTYEFGTTEQLQNRMKSQLKRWLDILKGTTPRYKPSLEGTKEQESYLQGSYLTYRPYEPDMWGPASYGTLVYDLFYEIEILVKHLQEGERLCKETLSQETTIDQDSSWKVQLYDKQYKEVEEKSRDLIEQHYNSRSISTTNSIYKQMKSYSCEDDFKADYFHKPNESTFITYVVDLSTLRLLDNDTNPKEYEFWGNDFDKINKFRFVIRHLDTLLDKKKNGMFDKFSIIELIKWCDVKPSTLKHKDKEHDLYDYIKTIYQGNYSWPSWTTIFELNKTINSEATGRMEYATRFDRRINRLVVELNPGEANTPILNS